MTISHEARLQNHLAVSNYIHFQNNNIRYIFVQCGLGGCLTELCIQLAIIMVGKQIFNALLEILQP